MKWSESLTQTHCDNNVKTIPTVDICLFYIKAENENGQHLNRERLNYYSDAKNLSFKYNLTKWRITGESL